MGDGGGSTRVPEGLPEEDLLRGSKNQTAHNQNAKNSEAIVPVEKTELLRKTEGDFPWFMFKLKRHKVCAD